MTQLARLTAGYSLASLVGPIFTVLLTPLYTRVLQPADYAVLDTVTTLGSFAGALASLGLGPAMAVLFYDDGEAHGRSVIAMAMALGLAWSALLVLPLWAAAPTLAEVLLGSSGLAGLIQLAALAVPASTLAQVALSGLRLRMAVGRFNALALTNLLLSVVLNVITVLVLRLGVWGIQATTTIVAACIAALGARMLWGEGWGALRRELAMPLIWAGLGTLPGVVAIWALGFLDRLLLPIYGVPLHDRGLYAIGFKLASMLALVTVPFQSAWVPLALSMRDDPQARQIYARVLTGFTAGILGLALALALFAREILLVFTTVAYADAAAYVAPLTYFVVGSGLAATVGIGASLAKRTEVAGLSTLAGAGVNLLLNLLLIPRYGVWGAAWATAIGYLAMPLLIYIWSQRVNPLPYQPGRVLMALAAHALLLSAGAWAGPGWQGLAHRALLIVVYPVLLIGLRVISIAELRALLGMLRIRR